MYTLSEAIITAMIEFLAEARSLRKKDKTNNFFYRTSLFRYEDYCYGDDKSFLVESISYKERKAWIMCGGGGVINPLQVNVDQEMIKFVPRLLKEALAKPIAEQLKRPKNIHPIFIPRGHNLTVFTQDPNLRYNCSWEGDFRWFVGEDAIVMGDDITLAKYTFVGGLVPSRE